MDKKINAYLDDSLSPEEFRELSEWIKANPENAQQFARASILHDRLQIEMQTLVEDHEQEKVIGFPKLGRRLILAAAAAVILFAGTRFFVPSEVDTEAFVTIARSEGSDLKTGERIGKGSQRLNSGTIRILFDSGVEVTLRGPAQFELLDGERMTLTSGLLTANVPPGAEGFRVDTPTAEIIDLGTSFGVHLDGNGNSHVSVFDGEVEVAASGSDTWKKLTEGEEVVVSPQRNVESVSLDVTPYEKLWPVSSGIAGSSGSFKLAPPWPRRLGLLNSDDHIFVVVDGYRTELKEPLKVNISTPGIVTRPDQLSPTEIRSGSALRSFILQYRPTERLPRRFPSRLQGSITFDRPIAGVIVYHKEFLASAGRFSSRKTGAIHQNRQLELNGAKHGDRLELSEDLHTLTVDLAASIKAFDVIRVVVQD